MTLSRQWRCSLTEQAHTRPVIGQTSILGRRYVLLVHILVHIRLISGDWHGINVCFDDISATFTPGLIRTHNPSEKSDYKPLPVSREPCCPHCSVTLFPVHFSTSTPPMAESSESPTAFLEVTKVAAPLLFGCLFNWTLYGVLCVQIYVYSYNFPKDPRSVKFLTYFIFVLETAQTALTGADIYYWFVTGFGNAERLGNSHFTPINDPVMTAVSSFLVQGYFCYRIWVLMNRWSWICWIIAINAVIQAAAEIWLSITSLMAKKYMVSKTGIYLWSIPSAIADILIAVAMTLLLRRASSKFSNFVLIRVIRLTVETNTLTASAAVTTLVLYVTFPNELYYIYTADILGKLYSNTLLVSLNNRIYFREHRPLGHGDSAFLAVTDEGRAVSGLQFQTPTDVIFQLRTISQAVEVDKGKKGGDTNTTYSPVSIISRYRC
ncbi:hypothetical protein EDB89DRAFT_482683 [Lactarius sanguifluus]|nr:hypothetical protein EDB89DRAFT_482683 [Lactarius sanguifluus]